MEQCMLFFDIDGTLITEDERRYLPDSAKKALRLAKKAGHLIFINTGRVFLNIEPFIRALDFDGYVCGCGTFIWYHEHTLFHNRLEPSLCAQTALLARDCNVFILYESADKNGIDPTLSAHPEIKRIQKHFKEVGCDISDYVGNLGFSFDKMTGWYNADSDIARFRERICNDFDYIQRGDGFCEIVPKGFSKASGIDFLCEYFHIPLSRCYAFGDSANDLSMLLHVPNSIGMANGMPKVLEKVSYITERVEENGLYNALKHYNLI